MDRKYHGRDIEIVKDGVDELRLLGFRPYDVYGHRSINNINVKNDETHHAGRVD